MNSDNVKDLVTLITGAQMPTYGLGTSGIPIDMTKEVVKQAVKCGYRLIDTANDYGNEPQIGEAIKELIQEKVVKREELFIQCKLFSGNHRKEFVSVDLKETLKDLQVDYVDSYIMHWPHACPGSGKVPALRKNGYFQDHYSKGTMFQLDDEGYYCSDVETRFMETWKAMEELKDQGLAKSIGISNFNIRQMRELLDNCKHPPAINQCECHPYLQQKDLIDFCRINKVFFQSFSPLGHNNPIIEDGWKKTSPGVSLMKEPRICNYL